MGELRQSHPSLKISQINELPKGDFLITGDYIQDVLILQSETKMKAAIGQTVKVSLPKTFETNKNQTKSLAVKGVPTDITNSEFKEFLDLNNINFAKTERLKSKITVGCYQFFDWKLATLPKPRLSFLKT